MMICSVRAVGRPCMGQGDQHILSQMRPLSILFVDNIIVGRPIELNLYTSAYQNNAQSIALSPGGTLSISLPAGGLALLIKDQEFRWGRIRRDATYRGREQAEGAPHLLPSGADTIYGGGTIV
jgi:hypothetical protein